MNCSESELREMALPVDISPISLEAKINWLRFTPSHLIPLSVLRRAGC